MLCIVWSEIRERKWKHEGLLLFNPAFPCSEAVCHSFLGETQSLPAEKRNHRPTDWPPDHLTAVCGRRQERVLTTYQVFLQVKFPCRARSGQPEEKLTDFYWLLCKTWKNPVGLSETRQRRKKFIQMLAKEAPTIATGFETGTRGEICKADIDYLSQLISLILLHCLSLNVNLLVRPGPSVRLDQEKQY